MEENQERRIYKDFDDWWSHGRHGWSSASRDVAKEIWDDLEPTFLAGRDDFAELMLSEIRAATEQKIEFLQDVASYVRDNNLEAVVGVKLYRWLLDRRVGGVERPRPTLFKYKGYKYAVVREVKLKHPTTGEWVAGVEYVDSEWPNSVYVREKADFEAKFERLADEVEEGR